jgi:hypothetical protein
VYASQNIQTCAILPGEYHSEFLGHFPAEWALESIFLAISSNFTCCEGLVKTTTLTQKALQISQVTPDKGGAQTGIRTTGHYSSSASASAAAAA